MGQYINKAAVVAEIERIKELYETLQVLKQTYNSHIEDCNYLLSFIDTLKVKEVEETTASDRGMAEEIIINLKRVEQDYRIDLTKEMEWVRNKAQKGE